MSRDRVSYIFTLFSFRYRIKWFMPIARRMMPKRMIIVRVNASGLTNRKIPTATSNRNSKIIGMLILRAFIFKYLRYNNDYAFSIALENAGKICYLYYIRQVLVLQRTKKCENSPNFMNNFKNTKGVSYGIVS